MKMTMKKSLGHVKQILKEGQMSIADQIMEKTKIKAVLFDDGNDGFDDDECMPNLVLAHIGIEIDNKYYMISLNLSKSETIDFDEDILEEVFDNDKEIFKDYCNNLIDDPDINKNFWQYLHENYILHDYSIQYNEMQRKQVTPSPS